MLSWPCMGARAFIGSSLDFNVMHVPQLWRHLPFSPGSWPLPGWIPASTRSASWGGSRASCAIRHRLIQAQSWKWRLRARNRCPSRATRIPCCSACAPCRSAALTWNLEQKFVIAKWCHGRLQASRDTAGLCFFHSQPVRAASVLLLCKKDVPRDDHLTNVCMIDP